MYLDEAKDLMEKSLTHTGGELQKIRAGRAQPGMLEGLLVDYYGTPTPIQNMATVTTPDARTLLIKPFERKLINEIERAIKNSELGMNPQNDGEQIRLTIPPLTEERRRDLVKRVKNEIEAGKVQIRTIRKDTNEGLRKLLKDGASEDDVKRAEDKVQELTNTYIGKIDVLFGQKETEIMTV